MTTDRGALAALLATLTMLNATPTAAQTSQTEQTPQPAPVRGLEALAPAQATQIPVPDAPKIVLPTTTSRAPAPRTTTSSPPVSKATTRSPATVSDQPAARGTPPQSETRTRSSAEDTKPIVEPRASTVTSPTTAEPAPVPPTGPTPTAPPTTTDATPSTAPTGTPAPAATQESTLAAPEAGRAMPLWLSLAVIVVVLAGLWFLRRRKPAARYDRVEPEFIAEPTADPAEQPVTPQPPEPDATSVAASVAGPAVSVPTAPKFLEPRVKTPPPPPAQVPAPASPRARIGCELRPLRAGLNLLSATVECELVVTNAGDAPAEAIRTGVALLTAHADQDVDLAAFNAAWVARPAAAPFTLAPGETRTIRTVVAIAREAIRTMTAANRQMFVPVVATNILYTTAGDDAQTARAWVVGIERVDSAKLAPFWLDAPARMFTTVAARPHAATFER